MNIKLFTTYLVALLTLTCLTRSQDNIYEEVKWSQSPSTQVHVLYSPLPQTDNYVNPNKETRVVNTEIGTFLLDPNIRPYPHTATQSEIDATCYRFNPNVVWCAWNSFGPSFYGTGYARTTDGGTTWAGNYQTFTPNSGDPACWVFPNGTAWAGRYGHSVIQGAGYSTNNGSTWTFGMNFPGASSFDKNLSAVDDVPGSPYLGRAYTVWTNFGGTYVNRIVGSYSTDGGATWTTAAPVSPAPASGHHQQGCDVEVGPGGVVYVVWAHCTTNGQNSTEDHLGFAKSTDGGVTWSVSVNNVVDVNGIRALPLFNGIRAAGFPRIDVDKTGGPRNGWIYVTLAEKTIAPATDVADITMCRSTNGGTNWTHTRVNQDTPGNGRYQYFNSVVVDPTGGVNVAYYDQRNTTGYVTQFYLSRSLDGANTWTDVQVSDHNFTPAPIPGLAGGYQGDYTTIAYGSNNKLWPFWADNSSGIYQTWTCAINLGPGIQHTPLPNTENIAGPYVVNCVITPAGSNIDPTKTRLFWSRNNPTITDSLLLTNTSGTNWTGNIPGNSTNATYRYYIKTADLLGRYATAPSGAPGTLYSFLAAADTVKPIITHTPLGDIPRLNWPATVAATVTDNIGIDSAWVRWYKNTTATGWKQFKLINVGGSNYSAAFNSDTSQVAYNDSIFYRIIARDNSSAHNRDSTALYKFKIIAVANSCIGTGTTAVGWPFYTFYHDSRTQMLYTASEIITGGGAQGNITRIGFNVVSNATQSMEGFNIRMQNTTATSITSWVTTGWTTVYTGSYTVPGTGWQYINLQTPFFWNSTQNLLVEICFDNTSYTSNTTVNSTAVSNMTYHYHTDGSTGCSMTGTNSATSRPNMCMSINLIVGNGTVQSQIPAVYSLEQNYPNPFNPSTSIKFNVPKQSLVKLTVYDVVGREITTLVNEMKKPGSYEAVFNAENFASGVYFYRLEAGDFTDVKKMVLVK